MPGKRIIMQKPKPAKAPRKRAAKRSAGVGSLTQPRLDAAARKWISLLADPCNAPLVEPCYGGTGTGYLSRVRDYVYPNASAVDFLLEFTPFFDSNSTFRSGWSATSGGALGTAGAQALGGLMGNINVVGRKRCVAACVKVIYTGAELERKGLVAGTLDSGITLFTAETINGNAPQWLVGMPHTARMGSEKHEFLWVPGDGDQNFRICNSTGEEVTTNENNGSSLQIVISGAPAGSFILECTSCWEWQPNEESNAPAGIVGMKGPASAFPLSAILHSIGDIGKFVLSRTAPLASTIVNAWMDPSRSALRIAY